MADIYRNDLPFFMRWLGVWAIQDRTIRANWFEWSPGFGLALQYMTGHDQHESRHPCIHIKPIYGNLFLYLPWVHFYEPGGYDTKSWGFYWSESSLWLQWGVKYKSFDAPWAWTNVRHEVMRPDGSLVPFVGSWELGLDTLFGDDPKEPDGRHTETHGYSYTLRSGERQHRKATIYVEEWESRWRWFKWLSWPRLVSRCISVDFNGEVGEGTGSWKGGTVGCGYTMLSGETPLSTLRRMEAERKFNR